MADTLNTLDTLRLLIIDCYDTDGQLGLQNSGVTLAGHLYKDLLNRLSENIHTEIYNIALIDPDPVNPSDYDGVCWTGSNLFLAADNPASGRHVELCSEFFNRGIPQFGSCWGAQLACYTAGGTVEANSLGREFGFIRDIVKTDSGKTHPMLAGKPDTYSGFASHRDSVTTLPEDSVILAGNSHSPVQAVDVKFQNGHFWATQYHTEYNYVEIAKLAQTRKQNLINDGVFEDESSVDQFSEEFTAYQNESAEKDVETKWGLNPIMRHPSENAYELSNWLKYFFNLQTF